MLWRPTLLLPFNAFTTRQHGSRAVADLRAASSLSQPGSALLEQCAAAVAECALSALLLLLHVCRHKLHRP